jgi:3-hydroxy-3-methylglutaryl CoA synthase
MLNNRMKLSIKEYEELLLKKIDGTDITFNQMDKKDNAYFYFKGISNHQRLYAKKHNFE